MSIWKDKVKENIPPQIVNNVGSIHYRYYKNQHYFTQKGWVSLQDALYFRLGNLVQAKDRFEEALERTKEEADLAEVGSEDAKYYNEIGITVRCVVIEET